MTRSLVTLVVGLVWLSACKPSPNLYPPLAEDPVVSPAARRAPLPSPAAAAVSPLISKPVLAGPAAPALNKAGENLIIEFEVGGKSGYKIHPEAPDARYSGVTQGIGYDNHANSVANIILDFQAIGSKNAGRLASTHLYYGKSAQAHLHEVIDIVVPFVAAYEIFTKVDVAKEFAADTRAFSGFGALRVNAQAAIVSLTFNRGNSVAGPNRTEMRAIKDLIPKKDYDGMAAQFRKMVRVWRGTEIERGMTRRRLAEAKLMETP